MASPNSSMTTVMSDHDQNSVKYKGVRKRKWGKWVSEIRLPNSRERIWLGSYDSPEKAARAFDAALFCLRGDRANFNFPDTPFLFHLPSHHDQQPLTHHQIQLLASSFGNQFNHHQTLPSLPETPHEAELFHSVSDVSMSETTCTSSSSSCVQVEDESTIDWSFLNSLDSNDDDFADASIDCGLYSELDYFGQFGESTTSELYAPTFDYNAQESHYEDAYSHNYSSFLWNFG